MVRKTFTIKYKHYNVGTYSVNLLVGLTILGFYITIFID